MESGSFKICNQCGGIGGDHASGCGGNPIIVNQPAPSAATVETPAISPLVAALRTNFKQKFPAWKIQGDAADEITRLERDLAATRQRCKRLEKALVLVLAVGHIYADDTPDKPSVIYGHPNTKQWVEIFLAAKQALTQQEPHT